MGYDLKRISEQCPEIKKLIFLRICDSTNQVARQLAEEKEPEYTVVLTDEQIAGRGRLGRTWYHDAADGIAMSVILRPKMQTESLPMITLAAALSMYHAVVSVTGIETEIKWPNDILYNGKKLCGILTEGVIDGDNTYAVLGIGMNVNQTEIPEELKETAISMKMINGENVCREDLIIAITREFIRNYNILQQDGDLRNIYQEYNRHSLLKKGINEKGEQIT